MEIKFKTYFEGTFVPCNLDTERNLIIAKTDQLEKVVGATRNHPHLPVLPVIQYTGKTDKNGKEVWAGHLLQYGAAIFTVLWNEKISGFDLMYIDEQYGEFSVVLGMSRTKEMQIVGHVLQNQLGD